MENEFTIKHINNIAVISLNDDLSLDNIKTLGEEIKNLCNIGYPKIIIDLSKTKYLCSSFLSELVEGLKIANLNNGDIRLHSLNKFVMKVFEIAYLNSKIQIFDNEKDALNSFYEL